VGEIFKRDVGAEWGVVNDLYLVVNNCFPYWCILEAYLGNVVVEPFGTLCSISTSIVPIVVTCHVLEDIVHSLHRYMREEGFDEALVH
jgi:hypothetical protein